MAGNQKDWKPFKATIAVKKDGGGEETIDVDIQANDPDMAKHLIVQRFNKQYGSANWRFV